MPESAPPSSAPRVMIVGASLLFCESLAASLRQKNACLHCVAASNHVEEAANLAESLRIDVVLIDARIQRHPQALPLTATLRDRLPDAKLLVLGAPAEPDVVIKFIEAGANACLPLETPLESLVESIAAVCRGQTVCTPELAAAVFRRIRQFIAARPADIVENRPPLSAREAEILGSLAFGRKNKEIARQLGVCVSTVKNHLHNIFVKLQLKNRGEAARLARRQATKRLNWSSSP